MSITNTTELFADCAAACDAAAALIDTLKTKLRERLGDDADGSALVVHAGVDDHSTDPTGNAGDRIACGVIVE